MSNDESKSIYLSIPWDGETPTKGEIQAHAESWKPHITIVEFDAEGSAVIYRIKHPAITDELYESAVRHLTVENVSRLSSLASFII